MVKEPIQDLKVPIEAIREEEQKDFEDQEDRDNHDDHENEKEQPTMVLFTPKQSKVLLKTNRLDFTKLLMALKRGSSKGVGFNHFEPGNFDTIQD
jgi:hypothetical protein